MIRKTAVLFCDNEHGNGDVTFPDIDDLRSEHFVAPRTTAQLRKEARKAGWRRVDGVDYCDACTGIEVEG